MVPLPLDPDILGSFLVMALGDADVRSGIEHQIFDWLIANGVESITIETSDGDTERTGRPNTTYLDRDEIPAAIIGLFAAQFGISLPGYSSPIAA